MAQTFGNNPKKTLSIGILAHVDAGKTTLSEALLYLSGKIRKPGRVDHKDAYLDTSPLEKERGITIFSKQAIIDLADTRITLLDTPGHVDFSAEMERTLQVLDYAVMEMPRADRDQGDTETLWKLLARYQIPTLLFVNKMDQNGTDHDWLLQELRKRLNENCVDFKENAGSEEFLESLAVCEEQLLEKYLETAELKEAEITELISRRKVFPCYFGSALKLTGVKHRMDGLNVYT